MSRWHLQPREQLATITQLMPHSEQFCRKRSSGKLLQHSQLPARLAVVVGQPIQHGPYTATVRVPGGVKLMRHRHPEDRVYKVISGIFYIGLDDHFDTDKLVAYPPGTVIVLPDNTSHFH